MFVIGVPYGITYELKQVQCNGIVGSINRTQSCNLKIEVKQQDRMIDLDVSNCCGSKYDEFFKFISTGDSIRKEKGELLLTVKKMNTGETKQFDYPFCIE